MNRDRLVAWNLELQTVHHRLEAALHTARTAAATGSMTTDVLAHCYGFCTALRDHHTREDAGLFPRLLVENPVLAPVIEQLTTDHEVLAALITDFETALARHREDPVGRDEVDGHLDRLQARITTHFADEERRLDTALDQLTASEVAATRLMGDGTAPRPQTPRSSTLGPPQVPTGSPGRRSLKASASPRW